MLAGEQEGLSEQTTAAPAARRRDEVAAICAAFHALEEGVLISDERGRVLAANPAAARILGVPLDQILGGSPEQAGRVQARMAHGPEITGENSAALRVLRTGRAERGLVVEIRDSASGEPRLIRASVHPLSDAPAARPWGVVSSFVDMSERERALSELAFRDALTGLSNRRALEEALDLAIARAKRTGAALGVLFFDVDGLKRINDELGHGAGDAVLREIAARLRRCTRASDLLARQPEADVIGRLGGDEFLLLVADLPAGPAPTLERVAERVQDSLREPVLVAGTPVTATVSLGMSRYPQDGETPAALLARADEAMYAAKRARPGGP